VDHDRAVVHGSMVDHGRRRPNGSPERGLGALLVSGSSPVVVGNEEEACGVPTVGEGGRCGAGGTPTTVDRKGGGLELSGRAIRVRMERADARTGNMMWRWCSRAAFIGRGTTEGGRSRSYRRRLGGASMAKPFRAGEKMGRGNKELGR
jgi:hypothetical protein